MRPSLLAFLILLTCVAQCAAHGSIAYGFDATNTVRYFTSQNQLTERDAETAAIEQCRTQGLNNCQNLHNFENTCAAVALAISNFHIFVAGDADEAAKSAVAACLSDRHAICSASVSICDATPIPEPDATPLSDQDENIAPVNSNFNWMGSLFRLMRLWYGSIALTASILIVLFLWTFTSVVSAAPTNVLKRKVVIASWVGLPSAAACTLWLAMPYVPNVMANVTFVILAAASMWTDEFAALLVGGLLRRRILAGKRAPDPTSLPLITLFTSFFTIGPVHLFIEHGDLMRPSVCAAETAPLICGLFAYDGYIILGALWLIIVVCGIALPADSNLIRANDQLGSFARRVFGRTPGAAGSKTDVNSIMTARTTEPHVDFQLVDQKRGEPKRPADLASKQTTAVTVYEQKPLTAAPDIPLPAIPASRPPQGMQLKLKRSQRSSLMGKVVFVLDARMELTAEELELVRKYRLGDDVIYESSSRKQSKGATLAHLEKTKGGPGFRDSAGAQFLGAGSTLYRLARAGVSATAAALSLRITITSLMSGVHVECKSMAELLGAETAIVEAASNLRSYLETAATFDGQEEIIEL
jgi:hypothetical protein